MPISKHIWPYVLLFGLSASAAAGEADSTPAPAAAPGWRTLARCAAAYRANSEIVDPARPKAMKMMIADTAQDYQTAAESAYQRTVKASAERSRKVVGDYVAERTLEFSKQPRETVERFIDACPQP
jgi:hypothetical protein